jgi:GDPmannose 4,6-dehydratase
VTEALTALRELGAELPFRTTEDCIDTDLTLMRTGEIRDLRGDARRARKELGWKAEVGFPGLVRMMVRADLEALRGRERA